MPNRLPRHLMDRILQLLEPLDILRCAAVSKHWNDVVHKSVYIQLALRQSLHQSQLYDGERDFPPGERLRRLITRETNLDLLRPRISQFDLPSDQVLHTVAGKYVITQPLNHHDPQIDAGLERDKEGRYTLCTIWTFNEPKKVKVSFKPYTDLFDLDAHQDVIIVQEDEGRGQDRKTNLRMRVLHLFNEGEEAQPWDQDAFRIQEEGWEGEEPHNVSLTIDGRVMIWCSGIVWIYDWKSGEKLGRIPPTSPTIWESNLGMAWAGNNIALGLDMPHDPSDQDLEHTEAYLAVFEVDTSYPGTSSLPLLLELPFCTDLLDDTVRDILDLPEDATIIARNGDHLPFLQRNGPLGLILVATEFIINEDAVWRLIIVLPTSELQKFELQKERRIPPPNVAWGNEWDPFAGLESIPYSTWSGHTYTWAEPAHSPNYYHGFYEAQNSLRLYHHDFALMNLHGLLQLTVLDFNQKRLRTIASDFKTLGGLGEIGEIETQADDRERRRPIKYKREVIQPIHGDRDSNLGCAEIGGQFVLGQKGRVNVMLFDGERLFLQQRTNGTCWILDFGVKEIVGMEGEIPRREGGEGNDIDESMGIEIDKTNEVENGCR
ncbi:hypothetical protein I302_106273 [Kwoniella bestiolae CBS 10118]|uniref:F-box domain-containing protein n=1 Tax=Kwoniella bestiolae CBS 10118 TaxID=1296100 RepID=A0A1B9G3D8_9TREE|nr:hypothetical protein I302_05397 [Kwoniella bestiolae CBS 10118]OCF25577.1 hypothetical protein I302_05397 [Kwoniella bestiolae CBS 10118]